jgi:hypothetical protein
MRVKDTENWQLPKRRKSWQEKDNAPWQDALLLLPGRAAARAISC